MIKALTIPNTDKKIFQASNSTELECKITDLWPSSNDIISWSVFLSLSSTYIVPASVCGLRSFINLMLPEETRSSGNKYNIRWTSLYSLNAWWTSKSTQTHTQSIISFLNAWWMSENIQSQKHTGTLWFTWYICS